MRLVIDTDAGVDDAQAIIMALTHPDVTVEAITTVTGNVHVDKVTANVFTTLEVVGRKTPVFRGADLPLVASWHAGAPEVHGGDGLGDWIGRPMPKQCLESEHAVQALIRLVNESPGELTLVALGPLTNIALAIRLDPSFASKVKQFVFMGGTISAVGNTNNITAEFNIYCDPEAAYITLGAFADSTMLSWETTLQHPMSWGIFEQLCATNTAKGRFLKGTTEALVNLIKNFRDNKGYLLPDPLAMAVAIEPGLITKQVRHFVTVELQGRYTRGQTVVDYMGLLQSAPNVTIVTDVDLDGVIKLYRRMLA